MMSSVHTLKSPDTHSHRSKGRRKEGEEEEKERSFCQEEEEEEVGKEEGGQWSLNTHTPAQTWWQGGWCVCTWWGGGREEEEIWDGCSGVRLFAHTHQNLNLPSLQLGGLN